MTDEVETPPLPFGLCGAFFEEPGGKSGRCVKTLGHYELNGDKPHSWG